VLTALVSLAAEEAEMLLTLSPPLEEHGSRRSVDQALAADSLYLVVQVERAAHV